MRFFHKTKKKNNQHELKTWVVTWRWPQRADFLLELLDLLTCHSQFSHWTLSRPHWQHHDLSDQHFSPEGSSTEILLVSNQQLEYYSTPDQGTILQTFESVLLKRRGTCRHHDLLSTLWLSSSLSEIQQILAIKNNDIFQLSLSPKSVIIRRAAQLQGALMSQTHRVNSLEN